MQKSRLILIWVCVFAVAFGGGAATYAQLSDTEEAQVSAQAGTFDLCKAGETITYVFSENSDTLVNVGGPDIVTFSNYNYDLDFGALGNPEGVDAVDFKSTEPIKRVKFRTPFGYSDAITFNPPVTQRRLDPYHPLETNGFVKFTFICAGSGGASSGSGSGASVSSIPEVSSSTADVFRSSIPDKNPVEPSSSATENGTQTPTLTQTPTATPMPTETTANRLRP